MKKHQKKHRGFTALEMLIVLAIVGLLLGIGIPGYIKLRKNAVLKNVKGTINILGTACTGFLQKPGGLGYIPLTAGATTSVFTYNSAITGATAANLDAGAALDTVFINEKLVESPVQLGVGPQSYPATTAAGYLYWDPANNRFDASATPNIDLTNFTRIECQMSVSGATPGTGTNYYVSGNSNVSIAANHRVVSLIVPSVPLADAIDIANYVDNMSLPTSTTSNTFGHVTWATGTNGLVTLAIYIADY